MIWAILALLGVPVWLCALGISVLVLRRRAIMGRPGNISVRVRPFGRSRWTRANAVWVSDVFVWRARPQHQPPPEADHTAAPDPHAPALDGQARGFRGC